MEATILNEDEHIRHVRFPDGSEGYAAMSEPGLYQLTAKANTSKYRNWRTLRLPLWDNLVHSLLEK